MDTGFASDQRETVILFRDERAIKIPRARKRRSGARVIDLVVPPQKN